MRGFAPEWVELPNTLGMTQFADGGLMASKPYVATGQYIDRMSGYCKSCRYDPKQRSGDAACPFTTLYWDFLIRHADKLRENPRMALQVRNQGRLDDEEKRTIRDTDRFEIGSSRQPDTAPRRWCRGHCLIGNRKEALVRSPPGPK